MSDTLRDQFAMAALTGILTGDAFQRADRRHDSMAQQAYMFADAMMAARAGRVDCWTTYETPLQSDQERKD